ncbi:MAG: ATP-dependent RecD-like DNA helicase, partial [Planctomycetes bacterium]|nr:ATP-dependent RecD-like DNA helicase [Planctomycetota bacterium]
MNHPASSSLETIEGYIERIIYQNDESGYGVLILTVEAPTEKGAVSIIGPLATVRTGERLRCQGSWTVHPRYGRQFEVTEFEIRHPGTRQGIIKYLSSGKIKGIGPKLAETIVDTLGMDALKLIDESPERLLSVPGIGENRLEMIKRSWGAHKGLREILVFFQGYGLGPAHAARVYREYGNAAIRLVKENPYRLADEVFGIGFKTADKIAINLGVESDSPFRIRATLSYLLDQAAQEGHLCLPLP